MIMYGSKIKFEEVPDQISESEVINYVRNKRIGSPELNRLKTLSKFSDEVISGILGINVKTFRHYKKPSAEFGVGFKEKLLLLLSLLKYGEKVFGSMEKFTDWLQTKNFHFDNEPPVNFLQTISGIRFIEDRLTGMEFGDNI